MRPKHLYWFAYFNEEEPSVRYRAGAPLWYFREHYGITSTAFYPDAKRKGFLRFLKLWFEVAFFRRKDSVIVFQKIYTNGLYAKALKMLLRLQPRHTLYDIDDAEWCRRPADTIHYFLKNCSTCSAGSKALVAYIQPFNRAVFELTSPVVERHLLLEHKKANSPFTIGWIGYWSAHRQSLNSLLFPALEELPFEATLLLLGVRNKEEEAQVINDLRRCKNITVETPLGIDWQNEEVIYRYLARFNVGVSPLLNTEFNRAKSAFKLKQCFGAGVPVLGSPVGENSTFLEEGVNGYLCATPADFKEKICLLQNLSPAENSLFKKGALATVPKFSVAHFCTAFLDYFRGQ